MLKVKAILYHSTSGHVREYVELLSKETELPAYRISEALCNLKCKDEVLEMGWVRNRDFMGCGILSKLFDVRAICAVGMVDEKYSCFALDQINRMNLKKNKAVFYLRGG